MDPLRSPDAPMNPGSPKSPQPFWRRHPELLVRSWEPSELPREIRVQVLAFMRQAWPEGFVGVDQLRDWIHPEGDHPRHFVALLPNGLVAAHASALWREWSLDGIGAPLKVGGLSGVFSFRHVRGLGAGLAVVEAATAWQEKQPLDAGLFNCDCSLEHFYGRCGWEPARAGVLSVGPSEAEMSPIDESTLVRSFSAAGERLRERLATGKPLWFGPYAW